MMKKFSINKNGRRHRVVVTDDISKILVSAGEEIVECSDERVRRGEFIDQALEQENFAITQKIPWGWIAGAGAAASGLTYYIFQG